MNTTETDLIFERYTQTRILSEDMNDNTLLKTLLKMINLEEWNQKKMNQ